MALADSGEEIGFCNDGRGAGRARRGQRHRHEGGKRAKHSCSFPESLDDGPTASPGDRSGSEQQRTVRDVERGGRPGTGRQNPGGTGLRAPEPVAGRRNRRCRGAGMEARAAGHRCRMVVIRPSLQGRERDRGGPRETAPGWLLLRSLRDDGCRGGARGQGPNTPRERLDPARRARSVRREPRSGARRYGDSNPRDQCGRPPVNRSKVGFAELPRKLGDSAIREAKP